MSTEPIEEHDERPEVAAPDEEEVALVVPQGFAIDSDERAAWVVDKLLACDEAQARLNAQYEAMARGIARRREGLEKRFGEELRAWVAQQLEGKKGRTLHLLTGSCSFVRKPGGPRVVDERAALAWCFEHLREAIVMPQVKPRVAADVLKRHVTETGEIPAGVEIVDDEDTFRVKPARRPA
jgi:hypothetical protein